MQKISPLRSSIEAFNKFKAMRAAKADNSAKKQDAVATNPFGISFKGELVAMDVFDGSSKAKEATKNVKNTIQEKIQNTGKLLASAWVATINKFSSIKANAVAFCGRIKEGAINAASKIKEIANTEVKFENPLKYTVGNLQKRPASELGEMLKAELKGV